MNLKYRGVPYEPGVMGVDAVETDQLGVYRGISFRTKQIKASLCQPGEELTYRGVRYTR